MKRIIFLALMACTYSNLYADFVGMNFFPDSSDSFRVSAELNKDNLTTPDTKTNSQHFNEVFNKSRQDLENGINVRLDDSKTSLKNWDTLFKAGYLHLENKIIKILYEEKKNGNLGLVWLDPTSLESKSGKKIDIKNDNIE